MSISNHISRGKKCQKNYTINSSSVSFLKSVIYCMLFVPILCGFVPPLWWYIHGTSLRRMNPVIVPLLYFRRSFFHTLFSIQISLHVSVVQANYPSYIFRAWLDGSGYCREQRHFLIHFLLVCKSESFWVIWQNSTQGVFLKWVAQFSWT